MSAAAYTTFINTGDNYFTYTPCPEKDEKLKPCNQIFTSDTGPGIQTWFQYNSKEKNYLSIFCEVLSNPFSLLYWNGQKRLFKQTQKDHSFPNLLKKYIFEAKANVKGSNKASDETTTQLFKRIFEITCSVSQKKSPKALSIVKEFIEKELLAQKISSSHFSDTFKDNIQKVVVKELINRISGEINIAPFRKSQREKMKELGAKLVKRGFFQSVAQFRQIAVQACKASINESQGQVKKTITKQSQKKIIKDYLAKQNFKDIRNVIVTFTDLTLVD